MRSPTLSSVGLALSLLLVGCGPEERDPGNNGGGDGGPGTGDGSNGDDCSDDAKLVYVVDSNNQLSQWEPQTKTFKDLGALNCPASGDIFGPATPFSMAIDREANAWVLYSSGELFKVNTTSLVCEPTSWSTQLGLQQFGMGFSTEIAGGTADTLFVAGGSGPTVPTSTLARLDINSMQATSAGSVTGWPELTGTGDAELWGFFPNANGARIEKINKASGGSAGTTFNLPSALAGEPTAWAFAFWGGDFWVFLMKDLDAATTVHQIDSATGALKGSTATSGRRIVGAGVSTCAPTVIL